MIITKTPLRLSFLGGNTDFREFYYKYGGCVLTSTIDKYIYCIVKGRFDDLIVVNYSKKEIVKSIDDLEHELVREALRLTKIKGGIEISFLADIPTQGTGLGSSSAVTVGVLNALFTYIGNNLNKQQLAELAIKIEIDILKKPIGEQDQYAVALGGLRFIEFQNNGIKSLVIPIKESILEDFNNSLMLLYTGIERDSGNVLSDFDFKSNDLSLNKNKFLSQEGVVLLNKGKLFQFGTLLDEYWQIKKKINKKTSTQKIDDMYQVAKNSGAIGGKIIGAGGGGFLLVMFSAQKRAVIRRSMTSYKELPFRFENDGTKVIFNN